MFTTVNVGLATLHRIIDGWSFSMQLSPGTQKLPFDKPYLRNLVAKCSSPVFDGIGTLPRTSDIE